MGRNTPGVSTYNFTGLLDEVRIFDYGLSYDEVQQYYSDDLSTINENTLSGIEFTVFPNPTTDNIYLNFEKEPKNLKTFEIYSLDGKIIHKQAIKNISTLYKISLNTIPEGLYILKLSDSKSAKAVKILIR